MASKKQFSYHRDALVQSGIAARMIETLKKYKGTEDPEITFGVEDCDFRVEVTRTTDFDFRVEETRAQVIIEMPTGGTQAFGVEEGRSFGAGDEEPLTKAQFEVIQKFLNSMASKKQFSYHRDALVL
jgi:hypothetical protein